MKRRQVLHALVSVPVLAGTGCRPGRPREHACWEGSWAHQSADQACLWWFNPKLREVEASLPWTQVIPAGQTISRLLCQPPYLYVASKQELTCLDLANKRVRWQMDERDRIFDEPRKNLSLAVVDGVILAQCCLWQASSKAATSVLIGRDAKTGERLFERLAPTSPDGYQSGFYLFQGGKAYLVSEMRVEELAPRTGQTIRTVDLEPEERQPGGLPHWIWEDVVISRTEQTTTGWSMTTGKRKYSRPSTPARDSKHAFGRVFLQQRESWVVESLRDGKKLCELPWPYACSPTRGLALLELPKLNDEDRRIMARDADTGTLCWDELGCDLLKVDEDDALLTSPTEIYVKERSGKTLWTFPLPRSRPIQDVCAFSRDFCLFLVGPGKR